MSISDEWIRRGMQGFEFVLESPAIIRCSSNSIKEGRLMPGSVTSFHGEGGKWIARGYTGESGTQLVRARDRTNEMLSHFPPTEAPGTVELVIVPIESDVSLAASDGIAVEGVYFRVTRPTDLGLLTVTEGVSRGYRPPRTWLGECLLDRTSARWLRAALADPNAGPSVALQTVNAIGSSIHAEWFQLAPGTVPHGLIGNGTWVVACVGPGFSYWDPRHARVDIALESKRQEARSTPAPKTTRWRRHAEPDSAPTVVSWLRPVMQSHPFPDLDDGDDPGSAALRVGPDNGHGPGEVGFASPRDCGDISLL